MDNYVEDVHMDFDYDALIIGGGPAGLSAGLSLGRMSVRTLILDDGRPRNAPSSHANNFITRDGVHPAKWREAARADLAKYTSVELRNESAVSVVKNETRESKDSGVNQQSTDLSHINASTGFTVTLASGARVSARFIGLAYGITDVMPAIEGFGDLWGKLIFHCPFCHGYEVRNSNLALFGFNPMAFHSLPMIKSLAHHLVMLTGGVIQLTDEQKATLKKYGVKLDTRKIKSVEKITRDGSDKLLIHFDDGKSLERDGAFAALAFPMKPKSDFGEKLGVEQTDFGTYKLNERLETSVPDVFAAGDITGMAHSVLNASAAGSMMGAIISSHHWTLAAASPLLPEAAGSGHE